MSNTKPQAPGRTFSIKSPLSRNAILTKTIIENKNSLFHCLALASNSNYLLSSSNERDEIVLGLINKYRVYTWENYGSNSVKNELIYTVSKDVLKDLYKNFEKNKEYKMVETKKISSSIFTNEKLVQFYKILFEIVNMDDWKKIFKLNDKEVRKYLDNCLENLGKIDDKRRNILEDCFMKLLVALKKEGSDTAFREYLKKDISVSLKDKDIKIFQKILNCDIFILREKDFLPNVENKIFENRKEAIILVETNDKKVEFNVIGKLLAGNEVMRKFDSSDILIKKIKACFDKKVLKTEFRDLYKEIYSTRSSSPPSRKNEKKQDERQERRDRREKKKYKQSESESSKSESESNSMSSSENESDDSSERRSSKSNSDSSRFTFRKIKKQKDSDED